MKREILNNLEISRKENITTVSFSNTDRLNILNAEVLKLELLEVVSGRNNTLEVNLANIKFIDSAVIDVFNLVSRLARRYHSKVMLTNVCEELLELFHLVKSHSVFDIPYINRSYFSRSVA